MSLALLLVGRHQFHLLAIRQLRRAFSDELFQTIHYALSD
jgi:hypothetical protein